MDYDQSLSPQSLWPTACAIERCPRCAAAAPLVHVHGHAQCSACGGNILDCCQGSDYDMAAGTEPSR
jgi:hypothetical protein